MARKVIIDCDPGIDDSVAVCIALFDPSLEILALTSTEGCVSADQSAQNLNAILKVLDPDKHPRIGFGSPIEGAPAVDTRYLHGDNGLGLVDFGQSTTPHQRHSADKLICDVVRAHPDEVTLIGLGPLTNFARAFQRDPTIAGQVDRIVMMGGSTNGIGNITPCSEFNFYCDPQSARDVLKSRTTKSLIPLDITQQVVLGMDLLEKVPAAFTRAGRLLREILPFFFSSYHQRLGIEGIYLNDAIALLSVTHPDLFKMTTMAGDVEVTGELTRGVTVFDRRPAPEWRPNMEVATEVDIEAVQQALFKGIERAGEKT